MKDQSLRVLIVEDSEDDTLQILRALKKGGYNPLYERVETAFAMKKALKEKQWDIILCDYSLPKFSGPSVIALLKETNIDISLIIVTGTIGEETAAECMRLGAHDYIMKGNLSRLCPAIARELIETEVRTKAKQMEETVQKAARDWQITFDATSDSICLLDTDQRILRCNRAMANMFGMKQEELIGRHCWGIVHGAMEPIPECPVTRMKSSLVREKMDLQRGDRWFSVTADPILDETRTIQGAVHIVRDITERKKTAEALSESEYKYRSLINNVPDVIFTIDLEGKITFVSKRAKEISGYENAEMIDRNIFDFIPEEAHQSTMEKLQKGMKGEKIKHVEMPVKAKSGEKLLFDFSFTRIYKDGAVVGAQGTAVDITERKRAEEALRKSEEKYRLIFEYSPLGFLSFDEKGIIVACNDNFVKIIGSSREKLIGLNMLNLPDKNIVSAVKNALDGSPGFYEGDYSSTTAKKITQVRCLFTPMDIGGGLIPGGVGIIEDITERRKTEEVHNQLAAIVESADDAIISKDLEGIIVSWNNGAEVEYGYNSKEVIGKSISLLMPPDNPEDYKEILSKITHDEKIRHYETKRRRKDGQIIDVSLTISPIKDATGKIIGASTITRDITERKRIEDALRQSEEKYRTIIENIEDGYYEVDLTGNFTFFNESMCRILEYTPEEMMGMNNRRFTDKENAKKLFKTFNEVYKTGKSTPAFGWQIIRKDGTKRFIEVSVSLQNDSSGRPIGFRGIVRDVTERKRAEDELSRMNRALRMLSDTNQALIHTTDEAKLLNEACRIIVEVGGYQMAWIGFAEQDKAKTVRPVAHAGFDSGYTESAKVTWADIERGRGPGGTAIRTGQPSISDNIPLDPAFAPWREAAIQRGYKSNIALPLISEGQTLGELAIYSVEANAFDAREVEILQELADDLAFGITALRTRVKRDQAEVALQESEERYRLISENTADLISVLDMNLHFTYVSPASMRLRGFTVEEAMEQPIEQVLTPESLRLGLSVFEEEMELEARGTADPDRMRILELEEYKKDGSIIWMEVSLAFLRDKDGKPAEILIVSRDITERKQAEEILRESEDKYKSLINNVPDIIFTIDLEGKITFVSPKTKEILGYENAETINRNIFNFIPEENHQRAIENLQKGMKGEQIKHFQIPMIAKSGERLFFECSFTRIYKDGVVVGAQGTAVDITERKKAEEALRASEKRYRKLFDASPDGIVIIGSDGRITDANITQAQMYRYDSPSDLIGVNATQLISSSFRDYAAQIMQRRLNGEDIPQVEYELVRKDGTKFYGETLATSLQNLDGTVSSYICTTRDTSERKNAEEKIKNSEAKYRNIFENAIEGIYQTTIDGRFITANAALARMAGYDSPEEFIESIKDIETQLYVYPEDRKRFLEIMEAKGFVDGFEVKFYKKDGSTFWVVINARTVKDERGKILYLEGLIEDITIRKHAEKQLHQTIDSLKKAVGTTIQVLVSTVESRDPYTAGHQKKVADLARTIATEMGLPNDAIEGIRMAGSIHDIGKISIPAEILSKPTKLTNTEFSLIKEHSQIGYDMLKDVESPWPLAQIVYQHHERMNGTGYPRNLKGDEILIEARIMAVADVVEAMASHRPYRPALGIDAALEEIVKNKGILYDDAVADTCLKLFREKGYKLA